MANDALNKTDKLALVRQLFFQSSQGYTREELAQKCGVSDRTISRYLTQLQAEPYRLPLIQDENWRWKLENKGKTNFTLPPVTFQLEDAIALTLAIRLLSRYADQRNQSLIEALRKLAAILPEKAAPYLDRIRNNMEYRPQNIVFEQVFQTVVASWVNGQVVALEYPSAKEVNGIKTHWMSPYLIHPSVVGHATYVIGPCRGDKRKYVTLKLERVLKATSTNELYVVPPEFDGVALLNTAWDIWYQGDDEPLMEVVLRFVPKITPRVLESYWHPNQKVDVIESNDEPKQKGGCFWRVKIANTLEIEHWIRQWGPDVEVIAPVALREKIANQMRAAAEIYEEEK